MHLQHMGLSCRVTEHVLVGTLHLRVSNWKTRNKSEDVTGWPDEWECPVVVLSMWYVALQDRIYWVWSASILNDSVSIQLKFDLYCACIKRSLILFHGKAKMHKHLQHMGFSCRAIERVLVGTLYLRVSNWKSRIKWDDVSARLARPNYC